LQRRTTVSEETKARVNGQQKRILIVEDDPDLAMVMGDVLAAAGYGIEVARNGQEGLWHLRHHGRPNLVLLDLWMPIMNGWEFRELQLKDPALASIPVVVVSADADLERATSLDAAVHLRKPIRLVDLVSVVRKVCGNPH
jgi:CheY-like chemotaxis protein